MANPTTPGYLPFLKTFGFVFLSPPLCGFLFVAGKTDGPGICFTLQYLRKGFNSFPLTALYHVFTPHSGEVKYTKCPYILSAHTGRFQKLPPLSLPREVYLSLV